LTIAHAARGDQLASALDTAKQSTLLNWLFLRGPYDIVQFIGDNFAVEIPAERNVGGNCEACAILFGNAAIAQRIDEALALKAHEIAGELSVLQALEWLDPQSVLSLWSRRTHIDTRRLHA
jgi:hypothetical protein